MIQAAKSSTLMEAFSNKPATNLQGKASLKLKKSIPEIHDWLGSAIDLRETNEISQKKVDFAIAPIFAAGRAALVTGLGASSKSMLLKQLAVAVTTGRDTLGMSIPKQGKVNRPGSTRHFRAVGIDVFRTLPEKRHQTCCGGAWGCRTSQCN